MSGAYQRGARVGDASLGGAGLQHTLRRRVDRLLAHLGLGHPANSLLRAGLSLRPLLPPSLSSVPTTTAPWEGRGGAAGAPGTREGGAAWLRWQLRGRRPSAWTVLVPVVALSAGLLFATSGRTAQGTDLRAGEVTELSELIAQRETVIARQAGQLADLQEQVDRLTEQTASRDGAVAAAQTSGDVGALSAALVPLTGPRGGHHPRRRPRPPGRQPARWTHAPTTW